MTILKNQPNNLPHVKKKNAYVWRQGMSCVKLWKRGKCNNLSLSSQHRAKALALVLDGQYKFSKDEFSVLTLTNLLATFETIDYSIDFQDTTLSLFSCYLFCYPFSVAFATDFSPTSNIGAPLLFSL